MSTDRNKGVMILLLEELFTPGYLCHLASDPDPSRGREKARPWTLVDRFSLMQQPGTFPQPGQGEA